MPTAKRLAALFGSLVRGICGSLTRSHGAGKLGSRGRRTHCRWSAFFIASCLSNQFDVPSKRYAGTVKQAGVAHFSPSGEIRASARLCLQQTVGGCPLPDAVAP
jgi:hypothetical protein